MERNIHLALSPGRLDSIAKLAKKMNVSHEVAREALKQRKHIPQLAEEFLREAAKGTENYQLWNDYLAITTYDRVEF